jgi:HPt (histidine-containing phosphotransfer) domain-containing protein
MRSGARDAVGRDLHTLKGVAATVGATALSKLAGEAEAQLVGPAGLTGDMQATECVARVGAAIERAAKTLDLLCAALNDDLQAVEGGPAGPAITALTPADTAIVAGMLRALQGLLQASDLDAAGALQALRSRIPAAAGPRLDALEAAVESLEFESALAHCGEWLEECEA